MKRIMLKYRPFRFMLIMAILPYILGLYMFQHHCLDCNENETFARIVAAIQSHSQVCQSCSAEYGKQVCRKTEDEACKYQLSKIDFNGRTTLDKVKIKVSAYDLLSHFTLFSNPFSEHSCFSKFYSNVIQFITDKPSAEWNCIFLL